MLRIVSLISIVLFVLSCSGRDRDMSPRYGGEISVAYLRSLATERAVGLKYDYTIRGYVVANDKYDEVSSCFVVADATGGVQVEVDMLDVDIYVPLFSRVTLRCSGLSLGRVGGKICLGTESEDEYVVGRIAEEEVYNRVKLDTTSTTPITAQRRHIADLSIHDMLQYLRIDSLYAIDRGSVWTDVDALTGDRLTTVRRFSDGRDTLRVVTSGRCQYAEYDLPDGLVSLFGVVDWYDGDIAFRLSNHGVLRLAQ